MIIANSKFKITLVKFESKYGHLIPRQSDEFCGTQIAKHTLLLHILILNFITLQKPNSNTPTPGDVSKDYVKIFIYLKITIGFNDSEWESPYILI